MFYRKIKMARLEPFDVPDSILNLKGLYTKFKLRNLLKLPLNIRMDEYGYVKTLKTMLHLEEADQFHFLNQFNEINIKLEYHGNERTFLIKKIVTKSLLHLILNLGFSNKNHK